ncbi:conserved protein of unknown function [Bacillus velezensis]|nr:hypothetical protein N786_13790 [Bacillus amyloliquefaciens UASWS BA1]CUX92855.1 conserved protein of unknown function [Bacillus velezensis]
MVFQQFIRVILPYKDGIQSQNNLLSSGEKINPFLKKKNNPGKGRTEELGETWKCTV